MIAAILSAIATGGTGGVLRQQPSGEGQANFASLLGLGVRNPGDGSGTALAGSFQLTSPAEVGPSQSRSSGSGNPLLFLAAQLKAEPGETGEQTVVDGAEDEPAETSNADAIPLFAALQTAGAPALSKNAAASDAQPKVQTAQAGTVTALQDGGIPAAPAMTGSQTDGQADATTQNSGTVAAPSAAGRPADAGSILQVARSNPRPVAKAGDTPVPASDAAVVSPKVSPVAAGQAVPSDASAVRSDTPTPSSSVAPANAVQVTSPAPVQTASQAAAPTAPAAATAKPVSDIAGATAGSAIRPDGATAASKPGLSTAQADVAADPSLTETSADRALRPQTVGQTTPPQIVTAAAMSSDRMTEQNLKAPQTNGEAVKAGTPEGLFPVQTLNANSAVSSEPRGTATVIPQIKTSTPAPTPSFAETAPAPLTGTAQIAELSPLFERAAPDQSSVRAAPKPFAESLLTQVRAVAVEEGRTTVQLHPRGLGTIEVEMRIDGDVASKVIVRVENPAVLNTLRDERQLLAQTIGVADSSVIAFEERSTGDQATAGQRRGDDDASSSLMNADTDDMPVAEHRNVLADGALDVMT